MEEGLTRLKNPRDKNVTVMKNILPMHWLSCLTVEGVMVYSVFQILRFEIVNGCFSNGGFLSAPQDWEINQLLKLN